MGDRAANRAGLPIPALAASIFCLVLAAAQVTLFAPEIAAGRSLDVGFHRVDGLGLVFGVVWCLGAAFAVWVMAGLGVIGRAMLPLSFVCVAVLNMAYAR